MPLPEIDSLLLNYQEIINPTPATHKVRKKKPPIKKAPGKPHA